MVKTSYQFVFERRERLGVTRHLAGAELEKGQSEGKKHYEKIREISSKGEGIVVTAD